MAFPFCIKCLNFIEIFCKFIEVLVDGSLFCISVLSSTNSLILPSSHNFNRLSNAIRWSRAFVFLLGFCTSKAKCDTFQRCVISPLIKVISHDFINKLLTRGTSWYYKNIFYASKLSFHKLLLNFSATRFLLALYSNKTFRALVLVELNLLELLIDYQIEW